MGFNSGFKGLMNDEWVKIWKEAVMARFGVQYTFIEGLWKVGR